MEDDCYAKAIEGPLYISNYTKISLIYLHFYVLKSYIAT